MKALAKRPKHSAPPPKAGVTTGTSSLPKSMTKNPFNCPKAEEFMKKAKVPAFNLSKAPKCSINRAVMVIYT